MALRLPTGYVDQHPRRGPWIEAETPPAEPGWDFSVLMPDGTTEPATWNGSFWWRDRLLAPVGWRRIGLVQGGPA